MATQQSSYAITQKVYIDQLLNRAFNELVQNDFNPASGGGVSAPQATLLISVNGQHVWVHDNSTDPHAYTQVHVTAPA